MRIAFYAPLKSPEHPVPSGDRQMARALVKALEMAGHEVDMASQMRSFSKQPHSQEVFDAARQEASKIVENWGNEKPDLWFSYHPYYKAPDFLALEIIKLTPLPIVTAEASLAPKRDIDEWVESQRHVRDLLQISNANFYFTDRDLPGLQSLVPARKLISLPPFIDVPESTKFASDHQGPVRLITIGMMRAGVKVESYALLAQSLKRIETANWTLTIVGDGQQRQKVESFFDNFQKGKIIWLGEVQPGEISSHLNSADIFVWPGFGEAYGLVYLEAQAAGLPVVGQNTHGVPFAVKNGETAILVEPDDDETYAQAILRLIVDKRLRQTLGSNARAFVHKERNLEKASAILDATLKQVCA